MKHKVVVAPERLRSITAQCDRIIEELLASEAARWERIDPDLGNPLEKLSGLVKAGGKRLRPAFTYWAFIGSGGDPQSTRIHEVGAGLELLHSFALIHDDIMDGANTRRGLRAVHSGLISEHENLRWQGEPRRFGEGAGMLIGDFAFVYADTLIGYVNRSTRAVYDELRLELCVGQYLDLLNSAQGGKSLGRSQLIELYKSGKYTVERPLHMGAAMADQLPKFAAKLSGFGIPLGEAFQLRDDLLGVFGSAKATGKPVGDDIREGKQTPLIEVARQGANSEQRVWLSLVGKPDLSESEVDKVIAVIIETGAKDVIEEMIESRYKSACEHLVGSQMHPEAEEALLELAEYAAWRDH